MQAPDDPGTASKHARITPKAGSKGAEQTPPPLLRAAVAVSIIITMTHLQNPAAMTMTFPRDLASITFPMKDRYGMEGGGRITTICKDDSLN